MIQPDDPRIQHRELVELFGDDIPIEVISIIWTASPETRIEIIRDRIQHFAHGWKAHAKRRP
jgi:hypothetical protein